MYLFTASPFLKALGWALVNSIWQFAICWLLYGMVSAAARKLTAAARHTLALFFLLLGTLAFIIELSWKYYDSPAGFGLPAIVPTAGTADWYQNLHTAGSYLDALMPYWSLLYLACIVLLFIKLCFFMRRAGSLQQQGTTRIHVDWRCYIKKVSAQLGIQKEVNAFLSVHIDTPQVIGFLKPVILVPAACLTSLSTEQLEAVLLHELVHIKRNDYLANLLIASVEILFFFNPFVKQLTAAIRKEREYSCDDMVLQFQYHPGRYASALLTLEKSRHIAMTYGIAAGGKNQKQLLTRIERIIGIKNKQACLHKAGAALLTLLLLGFLATTRPETSRPGNPNTGTMLTLSVNRIQVPAANGEARLAMVRPPLLSPRAVVENAPEKISDQQKQAASASHTARGKEPVNGETGNSESADEENESAPVARVMNVVSNMTVDFSLPQKPVGVVPETPETESDEPYVPASSFSYQLVQDTTIPKIKGETFTEIKAREALVKTQKALEQIDWQTIEKELNINKKDLAKLKKVITVQLKKLNWQKVNTETQEALSQAQLDKLQQTLNQAQALQQYRQIEVYSEGLRKHLTEQQQLIKATGERARASLQAAEQQDLQLQQEMKKRRIIYL